MRQNAFTDMLFRLAELERRLNNVQRPARVTQTDPAKGLIKVAWTEVNGQPVESPWIPWKTRAGAIKEWAPPAVGEQVTLTSPSGEIGKHSWVDAGGFSKANPQNHNKDGERKTSIGDTEIFQDGESIVLKASTSIKLEAPVTIKGDITHEGNNNQAGVHTDNNGVHIGGGGGVISGGNF